MGLCPVLVSASVGTRVTIASASSSALALRRLRAPALPGTRTRGSAEVPRGAPCVSISWECRSHLYVLQQRSPDCKATTAAPSPECHGSFRARTAARRSQEDGSAENAGQHGRTIPTPLVLLSDQH